jgi:hypothetical protein
VGGDDDRVEPGGELDVERIGEAEVVPAPPCAAEKTLDRMGLDVESCHVS